jgi:predicted enzyme related to lactoylglutathione lyase
MPDLTDVWATIPASDMERARSFYEGTLGLRPTQEGGGEVVYGEGAARFLLFPSTGAATGNHTQALLVVADIRTAVADLRTRGVGLEDFDIPGVTKEDGIFDLETEWATWFKDSEGNLLALAQRK